MQNYIHHKLNSCYYLFSADSSIDDKAAVELANAIRLLEHGITHLDLSSTSLTGKGATAVVKALRENAYTANTLRKLSFENTNIGPVRILKRTWDIIILKHIQDTLAPLLELFATPNVITHLNLASSGIFAECLFPGMTNYESLVHLNLANNKYCAKYEHSASHVISIEFSFLLF